MTTRLRKPLNNLLFLTSLLVHGRTPKKKSSTGTEENKVWSECLWWTLTGGIISPQTHFLCSGTFISHCCITLRLSRHFSLHVFFSKFYMSTSPEPFITSPKTICGLWLYLGSRCQVPYETINPVYRTKKDCGRGRGMQPRTLALFSLSIPGRHWGLCKAELEIGPELMVSELPVWNFGCPYFASPL